jgi:coproporphyrinogen III oxidase-like Fe-S oxidoreductase
MRPFVFFNLFLSNSNLDTMANVISQYFKRVFDDYQVLVMINPQDFSGVELIVHPDGKIEKTAIEGDEEIFEDLKADKFQACSALEFQLLLAKA